MGFDVCVFCKTDKPEFFEGVGYNPINLFHQFIANNEVDHCIVSRFTEYIPVAIHGHAKSVSAIFHDILLPETVLTNHHKFKWIFGLTDWHCKLIAKNFCLFKEISVQNYGIDVIGNVDKVKNSFIYSSFPNRGLNILLRMWPRIVSSLPDATLNIYCNLDQEWVNKTCPDIMREIKALLRVNKKGVTVHGWVSKKILREAWKKSEYWLYPCIFEETFCLTALEAASSKTCVISNHLAALKETVGDRGFIVEGDPNTEEWQTRCIDTLFNLKLKEELIEKNYQWSKKLTWDNQTEILLKKIYLKN
jgi:hypothetical protein